MKRLTAHVLCLFVLTLTQLLYSKDKTVKNIHPQQKVEGITIINDREIEKQLIEAGSDTLKSKNFVSSSTLASQLKRTKADVKIDEPWQFSNSPDDLYQKSSRSVLIITGVYSGKKNQCYVDSAGAFVISQDGIAVTNYHVIEGLEDSTTFIAMNAHYEVFKVTAVLAADEKTDVAIIQLDHGKSIFTPLPVAKETKIGENVHIISHPDENYFVLTNGIASRYASDEEYNDVYWLCVTAEFAKGSSGSPIFNNKGQVIGLVSATSSIYYDDDKKYPTDLQMVIRYTVPSQAIYELLK